jgi:putative selenate reductase molybdopterin-binding subunit
MNKKEFSVVNHSVEKIDAMSLALGKPSYVADFVPDDALYVKVLRSPFAHAVIKHIDISAAEKMPGVHCVLYHGNVPRIAHCTAGQGYPEPSPYDTFMFDTKVRHVGDRVAAVAAETVALAEEAIKAINVEYEELPAVLSIDQALADGAPVIHDETDASIPIPVVYEPQKNLVAKIGMDAGTPQQGLEEADYRFDYVYETQYAQHTPMEPYVSLAYLDERDRIVIKTSTQVPFHCRRIVAQTLDIPIQRIRVIKPRIGGGFGSKQEVLLEDIVAMVTLRTRRPAFFEFTRKENFTRGRTRHPIRVHLKTGVMKDGSIKTLSMDCLSNTGAYGGHGLTVIGCCGSKVLPLYHAEHIHFKGEVVYTNLPVAGAYRGFGATQAFFGMECIMDEMAEAIGMDPVEFRLKNHIKTGEGSPVFAALGEGKEGVEQLIGSCELDECIRRGAEAIGWNERKPHTEKSGRFREGMGMCTLMQGSSVPEIDMGAASLKMNEDGSFNLLVGATDLGTGSDTVLGQIAAEALGTDISKLIVYSSDTDMTPFDVGAYASSTTYLSGEAVRKAAAKVQKQILGVAAEMLETAEDQLLIGNSRVSAAGSDKSVSFSEICTYAMYERNQFQIMDTASHITHKSPPPFSAHFVKVSVDTWTGEVKVLDYVAAVDCGVAINPKLAAGQTEGGVMNGISYALCEEYLFNNKGRMLNDGLKHYHIYSMADKPPLRVILVESYEDSGPYGAKSVSEICINGPAPAIANALYNAVGIRLRSIPMTREKVWRALQDCS